MNGKVIMPRSPFARFRNEHPRCVNSLTSVYTHIVMHASYTGMIGILQTTQQKMRWKLNITRQNLRTALDVLHGMGLICCEHSVSGKRYTGTKIRVIDYEKNHRTFGKVTNQLTNHSPSVSKSCEKVQPINQPTGFKQSFKEKDLNAKPLTSTVVNTRQDKDEEKDKSASISHEIVKDSNQPIPEFNADSFEPAFLLDDSQASPHIDDYHNLINWFYDRCMEFGWRDKPPPMGTQLRQVKILLEYERQDYKLWAIKKMVYWQVERRRRRKRPISSFDFFDANKSRYLTPMQEALMSTWDQRQKEYQQQMRSEDLDQDGLDRLDGMISQIGRIPSNDIEERNRRFRDRVTEERARQASRKAILERLDPPDMTIPTVDDINKKHV